MVTQINNLPWSVADNPIIYHVITDRFCQAKPAPHSRFGQHDAVTDIGTYHGGDFAGITQKLNEGWFTRLGVNGILISAPYEQIRGWMPGGDGEFKHYAYHGYYALDYTVLNRQFGSEEDLKQLVSTAHRLGICVLLDIVMNHPGYEDLQTLHELGIGAVLPEWEEATPADYYRYFDYQGPAFGDWWGGDWVRCDLPGYPPGGDDDLTMQLFALPDFRTESDAHVRLPRFLANKPDTRAGDLPETTVRGYLVKWLADWVRQYGVDGFRCDSAKHIELDAWHELKQSALDALRDWKQRNPDEKIDDAPFWMTGEVYGNGIDRNYYFDFGFDNLINFQFQHDIQDADTLDEVFSLYARRLGGHPGYNVLSYISSHDTYLYDRAQLMRGGTALLLAPGGVQILYGDETARPAGPCTASDPAQATRSDMNWGEIDHAVLEHWQKLGQFRARHVAIARGVHQKISDVPYVFARVDEQSGDRVVIAIDVYGEISIDVGGVFLEGDAVADAYTGWTGNVNAGRITLLADGVVLLEQSNRFGILTNQECVTENHNYV